MLPAFEFLLIACCVTHLYVQIIDEQSVQECDATKAQFLFFSLAQKFLTHYSLLKLFTGFATAAFIAWKLIVANAIIIAASPPAANSHQLISIR